MRKGLIGFLALALLLGIGGYTMARHVSKNPCGGQMMMGQDHMDEHKMGNMDAHEMMEHHMETMEHNMDMMDDFMGSSEVIESMKSIHGEFMNHMSQMKHKYGKEMEQMSPQHQKQMRKELLEKMGGMLTKHGKTLKEKAKNTGK